MEGTELSPELQNLVSQEASKNNITNYTVNAINSVSNEGDGYIGIINGLTVIDKDSDKKLNLVVKRASTNENLRKQFPTRLFFLREIRVYDEVFPELFAFQEEYNIPNQFRSVTKLHGYIKDEFKEILLLENLKEDGYKLCKRQEPLDSHHLSLLVTEYAKLHALSHAMKKLQPERFEKVKSLIGDNVMKEFQEHTAQNESHGDSSSKESSIGNFDAAAVANDFFIPTMKAIEGKSPKVVKTIENFKKTCFKYMFENSEMTDEYSVICHGDCWSANLMFKYEDENLPKIPTKLCLIDWQMAMMATPIRDLSYVIYINAGKTDLENYMRYLHIYHTALSEMLTAFGLDPEEVFSFKLLEEQWKEKSSHGFIMCLIMLQQTLSEGKTHDFEELAKEGKNVLDVNHRNLETSDLYKQRMGDLVEFLVEHNFI